MRAARRPRTGYQIARDNTTAALRTSLAERGRAEYRLHTQIVDAITRLRMPGVVFWHCPNGAKRAYKEAAALKAMGLLAGVADLQISSPGATHCFLEIKSDTGELTEDQEQFLAAMERNGNRVAVVRSLDEALFVLAAWGVIKSGRDKFERSIP